MREKTFCMSKTGKDVEFCKARYQQAYLLMKLMKRESQMMHLGRKYAEWYGEDICANEA